MFSLIPEGGTSEPYIYSMFNVTESHPLGIAGRSIIVSIFFFYIKEICGYPELGKQDSIR